MTLPIVIINPESAGGSTRKVWPELASELGTQLGAFKPVFTERRWHARSLASEWARKGAKLIVACGGDGTMSEVANGILQSGKDVELGILPSGTGGDFRKTLGISTQPRRAARILKEGKTRRIDVGRVTFMNHDNEEETRFFLGVASFGMSAEVIERVKEDRGEWIPTLTPQWLRGRMSFGVSLMKTALQKVAIRVGVQIDDAREQRLNVANLCIANARFFGGGMKIAPDARLTDGRFDVITIAELGMAKMLTNAPRLYLGAHLSMPEVGHTLAERVVARPLENETKVAIELDGELPGYLPATFQILPEALQVRCP